MGQCADCIHWESQSRAQDEESPCSKLATIGVRALPSRAFARLWTPRDFACALFEDAERDLSTESQLAKWFPVREEFA